MNGQQMLKRDFVGDLTPREGRTRRATSLAAKHAAGSPVTLVTIGAASLVALACQLVAPLVAVPVIFGVLFLARLRNGRTWTVAERNARTEPDRASRSDLVRGCGCAGGDPAPRPGAAHAGERGRAQPAGSRARDPRAPAQRRGHRAAHRPARRAGRVPRAVPERDLRARDRGGGAAHPRPRGERDDRRSSSSVSAGNRAAGGADQGRAGAGGAARSAAGDDRLPARRPWRCCRSS